MEDIKVSVIEYTDRKHFLMRYIDPMNGSRVMRSTKVERTGRKKERTEAERVAAKWESELRDGRYQSPSKMSWAEFRTRYEDEVLASLAAATDVKASGIFNRIETILKPKRLADITEARLSYYQKELREEGLAELTIKGHLSHLEAALKWAVEVKLLHKAPKIKKPKRAKASKMMKGRPITGEEFDRLIEATASIVGEDAAESWKYYLQGLWNSGLRLSESLELYWESDTKLSIDLNGKYPMLRIPAAMEKGNQDRILPMAPEFAEMLLETPEKERTGRVFNPQPKRKHGERLGAVRVSVIVAKIGKKAGVKVNSRIVEVDGKPTEKVKFASAHDLRRSFGERWSTRVMPQVLMELMRHEDISTTMKYYVGQNAQRTADVLWKAHNNESGNTFGNTSKKADSSNSENPSITE